MARKVKCDRKKGECFLQPPSQFGRGGLVPIAADYLIPVRKTSKPQKGSGFKRGRRFKKRTGHKKRFRRKRKKQDGDN